MSNEEIIKYLKNCCDDLIDHIQNPNVNDNSYENWKMPE